MAQTIPVVVAQRAIEEMASIAYYIADRGLPETAKRNYDRMLAFAETLGHMPNKYAICRKRAFKRWNYRCAVFENSHVFIYKIHNDTVRLLSVLHGRQLR
jgi:plasmid stabilization system protein ParE